MIINIYYNNYKQTGSTNLHLDISDAVNLMMYAGIPKDYYKTELGM